MNCSIIVCTHNRADSLLKTVKALGEQVYDHELEIVVVDNASTDHTARVVEELQHSFPIHLKYVYEPETGLAYARNCGVTHAKGDIIFFIDDDAIPCNKDWVKTLAAVYNDPLIATAGGDLKPVWPDGKRPGWLHDLLAYNLSLTSFNGDKIEELHYPLYPWGANISYRKSTVLELNNFSTNFARKGKDLLSGEESELCIRLQKAGYKVVYVPNAAVEHYITQERLTSGWFRKRAVSQGITDARIERLHLRGLAFLHSVVRRMIILVVCFLGVFVFMLFGSYKFKLLCQCKLRVSWFFFLNLYRRLPA